MYPMRISSSKIISHSLRSIPVESEYCLSMKDLRIRGEIAPEASDKIRAALLLAEPPPQPLGGADDGPGASSSEALLVISMEPSVIPLFNLPELGQGGEYYRRLRAEVPPRLAPSNVSISGHSSPVLMLDDLPGMAPMPSS
jgi:hypothetical protein